MKVAVFCSSSNHIPSSYYTSALQLGKWLGDNKHTLVFGGATGGLMTAVSEGAHKSNGKIIGIIPEAVIRMKRESSLCTELIKVETMNERKAALKQLGEIFVVFPGSFGTLDEMFDIIASGIVGEHKKPTIIINENGFYGDLSRQIERMREEQFIPSGEIYKPLFVQNIEECISKIKEIAQSTENLKI